VENWILYLLLLSAIAIGWWLGRRERAKKQEVLGPNYYQGLNYLLNEQPDRAISTFIDELEVSDETLETHLALGSLLRRRGDVEKAVTVHQNILTRANLAKDTLLSVQLELAQDFLIAGLHDRAENILQELRKERGNVRHQSLMMLLDIYEQEKDWVRCIEIAELLATGADSDKYERAISHYHCERAEEAIALNRLEAARYFLSEAIGHDNHNVRTSLLLGRIELAESRYEDAIRALQRILEQQAVYVPESLEMLTRAYDESESADPAALRHYLEQSLEHVPAITIVLTLAQSLRAELGDEGVAKYIANHLKKHPTIRGLTQLIDLHMDNTAGVSKQNLAILRSFTEALVADKPAYRCGDCGMTYKRLLWHCPTCKSWGANEPIFGLEGQ